MAFPTIVSTSQGSSTGTSHVILLPSVKTVGNLFVVIFTGNGSPIVTTTTGNNWNRSIAYDDTTDISWACIYWKISTGVENLIINTSIVTRTSQIVYEFSGADYVTVASSVGQNSTTPNSPSLDILEGSALDVAWISAATFNQSGFSSGTITVTPPSGYGSLINQQLSTIGGSISTAFRNVNASVENPNNFILSNTVTSWIAWTIAVYKKPLIYPTVVKTLSNNVTDTFSASIDYPLRDTLSLISLPSNVAGTLLVAFVYSFSFGADVIVDTNLSNTGWIKYGASTSAGSLVLTIFYKFSADSTNTLYVRRGGGVNITRFICYAINNATSLSASFFSQFIPTTTVFDPPLLNSSGGVGNYLYIATVIYNSNNGSTVVNKTPTNYINLLSEPSIPTSIAILSTQKSTVLLSDNPDSFWITQPSEFVAATLSVKYIAPTPISTLPTTGSLSIKSATANSIALTVDKNNIGSKSLTALSLAAGSVYRKIGTNLNTLPEQVIAGGDFENGAAPIFSNAQGYDVNFLISNSIDRAYTGSRSGKIQKIGGSALKNYAIWDGGTVLAWARLDNPVVGKRYRASMYIYIPSSNPLAADNHLVQFTVTNKRYRGGINYSSFAGPPSVTNTFETVISNTTYNIGSIKNTWQRMECVFEVNSLYTDVSGIDVNRVPIFLLLNDNLNTTTVLNNGLMYIDQIEIYELQLNNLPTAPYGMTEFYGYGDIINTSVNLAIDTPTYFSSSSGPYRGSSQVVNLNVTNPGLFGNSYFGIRLAKALELYSISIGHTAKATLYNVNTGVSLTATSTGTFGILSSTGQEDLNIYGDTVMKFIMTVEENGNNSNVNSFLRLQIASVWAATNTIVPVISGTTSVSFGTATSIV